MNRPPAPLFSVRVKVPATTANLGPGFDVLGLALDYYNEVELTGWKDESLPPVVVEVQGEGAEELPRDHRNLVYQVVRDALARLGRTVPALKLKLLNRIPLARGMGSSSAAIVGGLLAAHAASGGKISLDELVRLAVEREGHPDNVVPALVGGLCVSAVSGEKVLYAAWTDRRLFAGLRAVVCVPDFQLSTEKARSVLPVDVSLRDAVFNCSRVGLFLSALQTGRRDLLAEAMEDRLHQPHRKALVPGMDRAIEAARKAGAWGAALSGAGPCVVALCPPPRASRTGGAMVAAFGTAGVSSKFLDLGVGLKGAQVLSRRKG